MSRKPFRTATALSLAAAMSATQAAPAIAACTDDAMIVFDGSGSMLEMGFNLLDEPRIFEARRAVATAVPPIAAARRLGLVVYGAAGAETCSNVVLRFAPARGAGQRIVAEIDTLEPEGETALTQAVALAASVLARSGGRGDVVLVTDGKETCGGAPCELAAVLAADQPGIAVHVIGFKLRGEHFSWDREGMNEYLDGTTAARCLAERTGGSYHSTETADELAAALSAALGCQVIGATGRPPRRPA